VLKASLNPNRSVSQLLHACLYFRCVDGVIVRSPCCELTDVATLPMPAVMSARSVAGRSCIEATSKSILPSTLWSVLSPAPSAESPSRPHPHCIRTRSLLCNESSVLCHRTRDVPNIRFVFASVPNSGPNRVFVFGRIVSSERIRIVSLYMYSAARDVYGRLHSVIASCSRSDRLILGDE